MYELTPIKDIDATPWDIPFNLRVGALRRAINGGFKTAVLLYGFPDTSTFRYRAYNICQSLESSDSWRAFWFFKNELELLEGYIGGISLACAVRCMWDTRLARLAETFKANGTPFICDLDDMVADVDMVPLICDTLDVDIDVDANIKYWFPYVGRNMLTARLADGFTCTNSYLGEMLARKFGRDYRVIPNFLNRGQLDASARLFGQKQRQHSSAPFTMGYFSGTPSHINDFRVMAGGLVRFMCSHPDTRLNVVGYMEFPDEFRPLIDDGRVSFAPLVDFITLQGLIAGVDVNLAPLALNSFTNCKSELKFFEPAAVGTVTLASPSHSMKECINNGENGFLCGEGGWYDALENACSHPAVIAQAAAQARNDALSKYTYSAMTKTIEDSYGSFL
jgi:glycosyltransferase involved in cell wall biosynthesis